MVMSILDLNGNRIISMAYVQKGDFACLHGHRLLRT